MAITSHAFGRVTLTDKDAKKFKSQVTYGKPKQAAVESAKRGSTLLKKMQSSKGKVLLTAD